jgi:hypothetical protein
LFAIGEEGSGAVGENVGLLDAFEDSVDMAGGDHFDEVAAVDTAYAEYHGEAAVRLGGDIKAGFGWNGFVAPEEEGAKEARFAFGSGGVGARVSVTVESPRGGFEFGAEGEPTTPRVVVFAEGAFWDAEVDCGADGVEVAGEGAVDVV